MRVCILLYFENIIINQRQYGYFSGSKTMMDTRVLMHASIGLVILPASSYGG
jgi:hypothetical protein